MATVSGTIDDATALVTVNGLPALNSGSAWSLDIFALQEGSNSLLVEARDAAGNKGSVIATVMLDTVAANTQSAFAQPFESSNVLNSILE